MRILGSCPASIHAHLHTHTHNCYLLFYESAAASGALVGVLLLFAGSDDDEDEDEGAGGWWDGTRAVRANAFQRPIWLCTGSLVLTVDEVISLMHAFSFHTPPHNHGGHYFLAFSVAGRTDDRITLPLVWPIITVYNIYYYYTTCL